VKLLSAFGFADDYYEQDVTWHSAIDGMRSIEALLREVGLLATAAPDLADDLQTLAAGRADSRSPSG